MRRFIFLLAVPLLLFSCVDDTPRTIGLRVDVHTLDPTVNDNGVTATLILTDLSTVTPPSIQVGGSGVGSHTTDDTFTAEKGAVLQFVFSGAGLDDDGNWKPIGDVDFVITRNGKDWKVYSLETGGDEYSLPGVVTVD